MISFLYHENKKWTFGCAQRHEHAHKVIIPQYCIGLKLEKHNKTAYQTEVPVTIQSTFQEKYKKKKKKKILFLPMHAEVNFT